MPSAYVRAKHLHARYLIGKLKFKLAHFRLKSLFSPLSNRLLDRLSNSLGVLEQYQPRPLRREVYPAIEFAADRLARITIVTPSYNQAAFLGETIESVLGQGYPHLEYAVVDGGSEDGSKDVLETYRSRLSYAVSEPDEGQAHAIIKGFSNTQGEIMAYLNSDDCLMPGALRYIGNYFEQHPEVDVVYGHRVIINADGLEVGRWVIPPHDVECVRRFDYIPQETLFWRRRCYEKAGGLDARFHFAMDWDLILRFMRAGARFKRLPYFLGCFRIHGAQKTSSLLESTGAEEVKILLKREFPHGDHNATPWFYRDRYRLASVFCGVLLKWGVRL